MAVRILSSDGRVVMSKDGIFTEVDCSNLTRGIYYVQLVSGEGIASYALVKL